MSRNRLTVKSNRKKRTNDFFLFFFFFFFFENRFSSLCWENNYEFDVPSDKRYLIEPLPLPRMREGWVVGMAVKKEAKDLAEALQAAANALMDSGELGRLFANAGVAWRKP